MALFVGTVLQTGVDKIIGTLRDFSLWHFFIFLGVSVIYYLLYAVRWFIIIKTLHPNKVGFGDIFLHRLSGYSVSYLTPSAQTGGEPLRVILLQHDGVPAKDATSSVVIDKGLEIASLLLFQIVGFFIASMTGSFPQEIKAIATVVLVIFVIFIVWFYYSSMRNKGVFSSVFRFFRLNKHPKIRHFEEKILEVEHQMAQFYKHHLKIFLWLIPLSLAITAFYLVEHYLIARFMHVNLTFTQLFLVSTVPYFAYLIPIPGGLGLLEGAHAAMFAALGVNINAFVLVFIIRIRDLVFVFIGLIHASKQGIKMLKNAFTKPSP